MSDFLKSAYYWIVPELTSLLGFLLAIVFLAFLLGQKRSPSSTIAWLLFILFMPFMGVPLYMLLGGRKMNRMAGRKARVYTRKEGQSNGHQDRSTERLLASYGVPPATDGNGVRLVPTGEETFNLLRRMIEEAKWTIHIEVYILGRDSVGQEIVELLRLRAAEGIAVRLLLDDVGSWRVGRRFLAPLIAEGARIAFFMPVLHIPFRGRANLRNHRKIVVADGRIALTGGMNLAREYIGPVPDPERWLDLALVVDGPAVQGLEALFVSDWKFATGEDISQEILEIERIGSEAVLNPMIGQTGASSIIQVVASGPDVVDDPLFESLLSQTFAASRRIWIVTPYFVPDEMLERALCLAARRGVDVRLIIPARSNHLSADLGRGSYIRELGEAGGQVLFYRPEMLHAKAVVIDDQLAVVGSANMDIRSLFLNYEVALFLYSRDQVDAVSAWAENLQKKCVAGRPRPGWSRQLAENVVRLLSPLL